MTSLLQLSRSPYGSSAVSLLQLSRSPYCNSAVAAYGNSAVVPYCNSAVAAYGNSTVRSRLSCRLSRDIKQGRKSLSMDKSLSVDKPLSLDFAGLSLRTHLAASCALRRELASADFPQSKKNQNQNLKGSVRT
jgi:hypothetical protein